MIADFNAHDQLWGVSNKIDKRRKICEDVLIAEGFNVMNDGSPTPISGTSIDLTLMSPNIAHHLYWTTLPSVELSNADYYSIVA